MQLYRYACAWRLQAHSEKQFRFFAGVEGRHELMIVVRSGSTYLQVKLFWLWIQSISIALLFCMEPLSTSSRIVRLLRVVSVKP